MKQLAAGVIFLFLSVLFTENKCAAQKIKMGLKGGVNFSNVHGSAFPGDTAGTLTGFHAGGFITIKLPFVSIQPELLISTAGTKLRTNDVAQKIKLTYISMPVMIQVKLFPAFYIEAGPQFSYKINEEISTSGLRGFINNLDVAVGGGIGFKLLFLRIYGRYMAGISKVGDFDSGNTPNFRNGVLQTGIALVLKGKK
jgi:Outer membrane protein beta-barrel domain